jgi:Flp pilus assembly pilin Flp
MAEYALLLALLTVICLAAISLMGQSLSSLFRRFAEDVSRI